MSTNKIFRLERPFIWVDLETTSAEPSKAVIVQIGMRVYFADDRVSVYKSLINPQMPIPKEATAVHGITDQMIREACANCLKMGNDHPTEGCKEFKLAPTFGSIAAGLYKGFANADFGGYNVKFDLRVLAAEFNRSNFKFDFSQSYLLDGFRLWQLLEKRTLSDASLRWLNRRLEGAHDAMADITATEEIVLAQLQQTGADGKMALPQTLKALHELQWPQDPDSIDTENKFKFVNGVPCFNFGKHKGKPMKDCMDYVQWMWGADFSVEVKKICEAALNGQLPQQRR